MSWWLLLPGCGGATQPRPAPRAAAKRAGPSPAELAASAAREAELVRRAELKQLHEELQAARALELAAEEELAAERLTAAITRLEAALAAWRLIRAKRPDEPKLAWIEGHLPVLARRLDEARARQADEVARWHRELPRREQLDYPVLPP